MIDLKELKLLGKSPFLNEAEWITLLNNYNRDSIIRNYYIEGLIYLYNFMKKINEILTNPNSQITINNRDLNYLKYYNLLDAFLEVFNFSIYLDLTTEQLAQKIYIIFSSCNNLNLLPQDFKSKSIKKIEESRVQTIN